uniref:Uncharacterized protein n=1 Tax=Anguilla anguilla TaxID=7936 RepID=A0A0E9UP62_ANGAN
MNPLYELHQYTLKHCQKSNLTQLAYNYNMPSSSVILITWLREEMYCPSGFQWFEGTVLVLLI